MNSIPEHSDAIALVGHGSEAGIVGSEGIMSWDSLYDMIQERKPLHIISLACYSPTIQEFGIFGFMGEIDAEAGAIIGTWHLSRVLGLKDIDSNLFVRAIEAQKALNHPLSRVVYFVHGYFGESEEFNNMKDYLDGNQLFGANHPYDSYHYFSYFEAFGISPSDILMKNLLHQVTTISDYANIFAAVLLQNHTPGTQVNIVAHSLGGIITRQMLLQNRTQLEAAGIDFGTIITFGTPHLGTFLANEDNLLAYYLTLLGLFPNLQYWPSPVFYSVYPGSDFMNNLNDDPESYSDGIRWFTAAGHDAIPSALLYLLHHESSDPLVGITRAKLSFAVESPTFSDIGHSALIKDADETFPSVETWLRFDSDSDGDGLDDDMETYRYGTDKYDWDSDNDGLSDGDEYLYYGTDPLNPDSDFDNLSDGDEFVYGTNPLDGDSDNDGLLDGDEVHIYGTIPTAWSTDGDILSDGQEIAWGYNPNNTYDPINAPALTYSAWQVNGVTGYVRANHYTAMDYVKVYVKYKNSLGYWTAYFYVGTDSSPYYYGDYYVSWSLLQGYVQMRIRVEAYNSGNLYLGSDHQYVTLPGSGGGGKPGGDPVPE